MRDDFLTFEEQPPPRPMLVIWNKRLIGHIPQNVMGRGFRFTLCNEDGSFGESWGPFYPTLEECKASVYARFNRAAPLPEPEAGTVDVWVNGLVAARNGQPYVQLLTTNGIMTQWTVGEARKIANDIVTMASRVEADAIIVKFFGHMEFPNGALAALMQEFRDFRHHLDMETVESKPDPEAPPDATEG
jgi:hypothetical protein